MIRGPANHDPEREVAAYVSGELSPRDIRRFETHLLECELCWREVQLNREGRRRAESSRESAPPSLREDVRAAVTLSAEGSRRRPRIALGALGIVAILASATFLILALGSSTTQPPEIAAALASYRSQSMPVAPPKRSAPDLSSAGLELTGSGSTHLGSMTSDLFVYREPSGARVLVFLSSSTFPEAAGATQTGSMASGWTARVDDLSLVCGSGPVSFLFVGRDLTRLQGAERVLVTQPL